MLILSLMLAAQDNVTPPAQPLSPTTEAACTGDRCSAKLTPEQMFALSENLVVKNDLDGALAILKALEGDPNPEYRAEARVRVARIYANRGDYETAALWYQKLLDEKPDTAAVRVELATVLAQLGNESSAARQLRRAASSPGLPDEVSRALGRASAAIRSNAPFAGSFEVGLAPDSNINRATQAQQIDLFGLPFVLDEDGRATSGVGLTVNATALARKRLSKSSRLIAQVVGGGDLYRKSRFNDITVTGNVGPEILYKRTSFRPAIVGGRRWIGQKSLYDLYGLSLSAQTMISPRGQITLSGGATHLDYTRRDDLTSDIYALGAAYEHAFSPRLSARFAVNGNRNKARAKSNSTKSIGSDLTFSRDMGRFTAFVRGSYNYTLGDAPFIPFPDKRRDHFYEGQAGLVFRQISLLGLSPLVRLTRSQSDSTVPLYDYRRTRVEMAVTRTF